MGSVQANGDRNTGRFERFRFSVRTVPPGKGFHCVSLQFQQKGAVPVSVPGNGSNSSEGRKKSTN